MKKPVVAAELPEKSAALAGVPGRSEKGTGAVGKGGEGTRKRWPAARKKHVRKFRRGERAAERKGLVWLEVELDAEHADKLERLAAQAGVTPGECLRRLLIGEARRVADARAAEGGEE